MNQQEYKLIASVIHDLSCELLEAGVYEKLVRRFASELSQYKSFDRAKFYLEFGMDPNGQ